MPQIQFRMIAAVSIVNGGAKKRKKYIHQNDEELYLFGCFVPTSIIISCSHLYHNFGSNSKHDIAENTGKDMSARARPSCARIGKQQHWPQWHLSFSRFYIRRSFIPLAIIYFPYFASLRNWALRHQPFSISFPSKAFIYIFLRSHQ